MEDQGLSDSFDTNLQSLSSPSGTPSVGDSGYASASATPSKTGDERWEDSQSSRQSSRHESLSKRRSRSEDITKDLEIFEKVLDKAVKDRFKDVSERLQMPLIKHIQKAVKEFHPVAVRLMVLGRTAEDAGPFIVIFCHTMQEKAVRKYCKKSHVRELCQPSDRATPSLRLHVIAHPPKPCASPDVDVYTRQLGVDWTDLTLSGAPITVTNCDGSRAATLGGLIKVTSEDGMYHLYGMTAGHAVAKYSEPEISTEGESEDSDLTQSDLSCSEDESSEQEVATGLGCMRIADVLQVGRQQTTPTSPDLNWTQKHLGTLGARKESRKCDWELIDVVQSRLEPNLIRARHSSHFGRRGELRSVPVEKTDLRRQRKVVLNSGHSDGVGVRHGSLSPLPSSIWLGSAKGMVQTIPLKLDNGLSIHEGDSGSWVVDLATLEVYGHLVASDCFGEGFVVPLPATLTEIKETLVAQAVELASGLDIICMRLADPKEPPSIETAGQILHAEAMNTGVAESPALNLGDFRPRMSTDLADSGYHSAAVSPPSANSKGRSRSDATAPRGEEVANLLDSGYHPASNASSASQSDRSSTFELARDHVPDPPDPTDSSRRNLHGRPGRVQKHPATFQCNICPSRFTRAYNLRSHLRTHTDEPPFVGKVFARGHDRKRHEGLESDGKIFVCRGELLSQPGQLWGCGRRFAQVKALGQHFLSEAGSICLKPLHDQEAIEQRDKQAISSEDAVGRLPSISLPPIESASLSLGTRPLRLPAQLLAQYPELHNMQSPVLREKDSLTTASWKPAVSTGGERDDASLADDQSQLPILYLPI